MTSRPSSLLWTSTRRVARPPPPRSNPRMVTCKCLPPAASRLIGLVQGLLLPSLLAQKRVVIGYTHLVTRADEYGLRRKQGTGIWKHDETTPIKYDLLLVSSVDASISAWMHGD